MKKLILLTTLIFAGLVSQAWNIYRTTFQGLPSNDVRSIDIDKNGNLWVATAAGLAKYNGTTWQIFNTSNSSIATNNIRDVKVDSNNIKWVTTSIGLYKFNDTNWVYNQMYSSASKFFIDKNNNKYLIYSTTLKRIDKIFDDGQGLYTDITYGLYSTNVADVFVDSINQKWICYSGSDVYTKIDTNGVITNYNTNGFCSSIGKIIDGTNGRKYFLTNSVQNFANISVKSDTGWYRLPASDELISDFQIDKDGDLWALSNKRLSKFSPSSNSWVISSEIPVPYSWGSKLQIITGQKWITNLNNNNVGIINLKCLSSFSNSVDSFHYCKTASAFNIQYKGLHTPILWVNPVGNEHKNNSNYQTAYSTGLYKLYFANSDGCTNIIPEKYYLSNFFETKINVNLSEQCFNTNRFILNPNSSEDTSGIITNWSLVKLNTSEKNPIISYDTPGVYNIKLITSSIGGCKDTSFATLVVKSNTTAGPMLGETNSLTTSTPYVYTVAQQANHTYNWVATNGIIVSGQGSNAAAVQWLANGKGSIKVLVSLPNGCPDSTTKEVTIGNVGLNDLNNLKELVVYPNPSNGTFAVSFNALKSSTVEMSLVNLLGQQIWNAQQAIQAGEQSIQINANLAPGVYTLRINGAEEQVQYKVIIK